MSKSSLDKAKSEILKASEIFVSVLPTGRANIATENETGSWQVVNSLSFWTEVQTVFPIIVRTSVAYGNTIQIRRKA